jgi:hypothetical protein
VSKLTAKEISEMDDARLMIEYDVAHEDYVSFNRRLSDIEVSNLRREIEYRFRERRELLKKITTIQEDNDRVKQGTRPKYLVVSTQLGAPFISAEMAIKWHNITRQKGVDTIIMDLNDYDWDANMLKLKVHDLSTEEGKEDFEKDVADRNQSTIN